MKKIIVLACLLPSWAFAEEPNCRPYPKEVTSDFGYGDFVDQNGKVIIWCDCKDNEQE